MKDVGFNLNYLSLGMIKVICNCFFEKWIKQNPLDVAYEADYQVILQKNIQNYQEYIDVKVEDDIYLKPQPKVQMRKT